MLKTLPMPLPKRVSKMVFIVVPLVDRLEDSVHAAKKACRVAHQMEFKSMCPLLYYLTFLSPGEISMEHRRIFTSWLHHTDRIWLQFPYEEEESLDSFTFDVLENNRKKHWQERRPVYQLHPAGDEFVPVAMSQDDVMELLSINLTSGLARQCV